MRVRVMAVLSVWAVGAAVPRADAVFPEMKIVEFFAGTAAAPNAQYVVLQMWSDGQNLVTGHVVTFSDRNGIITGTATFGGIVTNGSNQAKILISNVEAQVFFNVVPDLLFTGTPIRPEGGKICFEIWDCVAWGNYAWVPVGTPYAKPVGLTPGQAVRRDLGPDGILQDLDDTGDSAADFDPAVSPNPTNNAGNAGVPPTSTCPNFIVESLEGCDDGNAVPDDTCNATCSVTRLFADGFESGDVSRWHLSTASTGDLTVNSTAPMTGIFGLQAVIDDTEGQFVQNDSPEGEGRYRVRFRFDPNGFDPGEAFNRFRTRIFLAFQAPQRRVMAIVLRRLAGQYSVMVRVRRDDNSQANTGFFNITDGPHAIELDWQRSVGAGGGSASLWIDGSLMNTVTGIDNDTAAVDFVRLGALSVKVGANGTLRWDAFDSRQETDIGP
jgi:cysteine-rich repeat protein